MEGSLISVPTILFVAVSILVVRGIEAVVEEAG
jgi:hypothetical protein